MWPENACRSEREAAVRAKAENVIVAEDGDQVTLVAQLAAAFSQVAEEPLQLEVVL